MLLAIFTVTVKATVEALLAVLATNVQSNCQHCCCKTPEISKVRLKVGIQAVSRFCEFPSRLSEVNLLYLQNELISTSLRYVSHHISCQLSYEGVHLCEQKG